MERLLSITGKTSPPISGGGSAGGQKMDMMKSVCNSINSISSYHCCAICTEMYIDPRALPCLHTFCLRCLDDYSRRRRSQRKKSSSVAELKPDCAAACSKPGVVADVDDDDASLSCPLCRRVFQLPPEGASGLPRNVFAEDLVAISGISGRVCAPCDTCMTISGFIDDDGGAVGGAGWNDGTASEISRKSVRQGATASMCCIECRQNMCDQCCKLHRKSRSTRTHRIIAIASKDPPLPPHLAATSVVGELPEGQALSGIAVLDHCIFVVRVLSRLIDVYDAVTFTMKRRLTVPSLHTPQDMTSCNVNKCLYVTDRATHSVHRVVPSMRRRRSHDDVDHHGDRARMTSWPVGDWPTGISATSEGHVMVTCKETRKVKLFTTSGSLLRDVVLPADIVHPWHAAGLPSGQLVVCHGAAGDPIHRVVLLDSEWRTVQAAHGSVRGSSPGQLNVPARLAVDSRGFTVVADFNNARLVLLSPSTLTPVRDFVSSAATGNDVISSIRCPLRVCLDESRDRLYIGDQSRNDGKWADSRVLILGTCVRADC